MRKLILLLYILMLVPFAYSQSPATTGSIGLFHTQEGRVLMPGRWDFWGNLNFYTKLGDFIGQSPPDFQAANWWIVAGNTSVSYGLFKHLDATLGIRVYQDNHHSTTANVPDNVFLTLKAGSFNFEYGHFAGALWGTVLFPTAEVNNYPWASFYSGGLEYGFFGGISYYKNAYLPDQGLGLHLNAGWWNHNEKGNELNIKGGTTRTATVSSSELRIMLSSTIPAGLFKFWVEIWGGLYTTIPDPFVYSAEDYAFLTPSISYAPYTWMAFDLGVDIRISPDERQRTSGVPDWSDRLDLPKNYPPWRVQMGIKFSILPAGVRTQYGGGVDNPEIRRRIDFYERLMEEKDKAADMEKELEEIRKIREEADLEIEKIREILEE